MSRITRKVGDAKVSAVGFGAMSVAGFYAQVLSDEEKMKVRASLAVATTDEGIS